MNTEEKYKGEVVHKIIKERGYKLVAIADQLVISRATLYKILKKPYLTDQLLIKIGEIIQYDFAKDFPDLQDSIVYKRYQKRTLTDKGVKVEALFDLYKKYTMLLEESHKLMRFLVRIVNNTQAASLKRRINRFIRENIKQLPIKRGSSKKA